MESLPTAFYSLNLYKQFIVYKIVRAEPKDIKKPANHMNGQIWDAHDPTIWTDSATAIQAAKHLGDEYGVGFVFTDNDPFFFLDIDKCYDGKDWSPLARALLTKLGGAGVEVSRSNCGLHIIGRSAAFEHGCRNKDLNLELYHTKRFVALTGIHATGNVDTDHTAAIKEIAATYFPPNMPKAVSGDDWWSETPVADWSGPTEDAELLRMALASQSIKSKFGQGGSARFVDLWDNNESTLAKFFPPNDADVYNRSDADAALALHLAFWTGKDAERIRSLMSQSKMVREKWERADYLPRTIRNACSKCTSVLRSINTNIRTTEDSTGTTDGQEYGELVTSSTILSIPEQRQAFKNCVYICDENAIFVPGGMVLDKERFNVMHGGKTFVTDPSNSKVSKHAWEAFTQNYAIRFPKANSATFLPDRPSGEIIVRDGMNLVNTYWPIETPRMKGDVSPFLYHIEKLMPDGTDQEILINYLAAMVQYLGKKFQWCPVIQGVQGNGKTFISLCVAFILGHRYTAFPRADEITSKFNDWQYRTLGVFVEDFHTTGGAKHDTMETLKPMLTAVRQMIEGKNKTKIMRDICCNYIINTNHKEALRKTRDDRRFAMFYTGQQTEDDLKRDGMLGDYCPNLYTWAKQKNGFLYISDWLQEYPIKDAYNPLICARAPKTSSTEQAITESMGSVENEILEAIAQDRIGFKRGWINSSALNELLDETGNSRRVPHNRRRALMKTLGYEWHPGLTNGRTSTNMPGEKIRPCLYIVKDHNSRCLIDNNLIIDAYIRDQK